ncbi:MAG TPA: hypothetical protein ENN96_00350, partial [Candidatus Acetothermia bacterium]|nr:hypothetical protein [Candidatus Acetothermia bacterium]
MKRVEILTFASALHDAEHLKALRSRLLEEVRALADFEVIEVKKPSADGLTVVLVLTGGVERDVLKATAQLPLPILLMAHPAQNSLPAALEILARIRRDGGEGRILHGSAAQIVPELRLELRVSHAWDKVRFSRVGMIGEPSEWLVASDVDPAFVKGRLAVDLVNVDVQELLRRVREAKAPRREVQQFTRQAKGVEGPNPDEVREAVAVYRALRSLVDEHRLAACTVRCFDLVTDLHTTGCYALSRLNDEGIPAGCEGDLQTLFSLYFAALLTEQVAFIGNIASVEPDARRVGMAHCMCPLSMAMHYSVYSHFESGLGIGISGTFPD